MKASRAPQAEKSDKFISIFGLILFGASIFYIYEMEKDLKIERINLQFQLSTIESQQNVLKEQFEDNVKTVNFIDSEINSLNKSKLPKDDYKLYVERYNLISSKRELAIEKADLIRSRIREVGEKILEAKRSIELGLLNEEEKKFFEKFKYVAIFIPVALILFGFCLWYIKLQSYQDAIVKKQATLQDVSND